MSRALAWIERAGKDERKAEREARALARKARARAPDPAELGHHVTVPRWRWPAAFAQLEACGAPFIAEAHPTEHGVIVRTTGAGRARLQPFEQPERNP